MRTLCWLLLAQTLLCAQTAAERIDAVLKSSSAGKLGLWGIQVVNLNSGETLFEFQQDRFFMPASAAKLFSTALALERLGPDYRFVTLVTAGNAPDASGTIAGDLRLIGGGDPTLSGRAVPYKKGAATGNPLQAIEELADQVAARGVRRIEGDIAGDDTAYAWEPYPEGWVQDDALWDYGAPVSALSINDNRFTLTLSPGRRAGDPAVLRLSPPLEYMVIDNRVRTVSGGAASLHVERMPGSRQLRVWGSLPLKGGAVSRQLTIGDPAEFAAFAFRDALIRRGVSVSGRAVARHRFASEAAVPAPEGVELARRASPPLDQILQLIEKESLNLGAEMVRRKTGVEELQAFARQVGIGEGECSLVDASGLSVLNLVTPRAMTKLLAFMHQSRNQAAWMALLPVGGEDGTLSQRFAGTAGRIHAKTGTMTHVSTLAGYAETVSGDTLAFSILVNNHTAPNSEIRAIIDRIGVLLIQ